MASKKQQRKEAKTRQPRPTTAAAFRHPDGDRRRRGGPTADDGVKQKRAMQAMPEAFEVEEPPK